MSEPKREEPNEKNISLEQAEDGTDETPDETPVQKGIPRKSYMLHILGGIYLVWTGYQLAGNVIKGAEGAHWGFFVAGGAFILIGAGLVVNAVRGLSREDKQKKAEEAAAAEKAAVEKESDSAKEAGKMSIAQRAKLVDRINEEDAE